VLDEPVASLDPIARRRFVTELVDGAPDAPRTVLFSSHIVSDLERVANKVWILKDGRLAWAGDLDALKDSVVRLHIRARRALPRDLEVPNALSRLPARHHVRYRLSGAGDVGAQNAPLPAVFSRADARRGAARGAARVGAGARAAGGTAAAAAGGGARAAVHHELRAVLHLLSRARHDRFRCVLARHRPREAFRVPHDPGRRAPTADEALLGWAACWTVLAVAYLRAPRFAPYRWPPRFEALHKLDRRFAADTGRTFTRAAAFATWLTGTLPWGAKQWLTSAVIVLLGAAVVTALLRNPVGLPGAIFLANLAVLPIVGPPAANIIARRTKLLCLVSGQSRRALFASVERNLWAGYLPRGLLATTSFAAAMGLAFDLTVRMVGGVLLVFASSTPLAIYLGLAATRRIRLLEVVAAVPFVASVALGTWAALAAPQHTGWLARVTAAQVVAAVAVRAFAILRWQRLDWLEFRPVRLLHQRLGVR
jgi:hypothetical protein